jgi:hypothetical protein
MFQVVSFWSVTNYCKFPIRIFTLNYAPGFYYSINSFLIIVKATDINYFFLL